MYNSYIFDVDGTLIDSETIILTALQELIKEEQGKVYLTTDLSFAMAMTSLETLKTLRFTNPALANNKWIALIKKHAKSIKPFDGIEQTIRGLHANNKKLGIVTSKTHEEIACDFELTSIYQLFDAVVTASDTNHPKPHPEPLLKCLDILQSTPEDTLYIGDTNYDAECANFANVDFGLALWGAKTHVNSTTYSFSHPKDILKTISMSIDDQ